MNCQVSAAVLRALSLEVAEQGKVQVCSPHIAKEIGETRYLRLHIRRGDAGLWEWKIYE